MRPVIILGAGRSGTKFLRNLLASSTICHAVPYDMNYVWKYGNETHPDDALPPEASSTPIAQFIRQNLSRMAGIRQATSPYLIEKTSANTLRPGFVHTVFPDAFYLHIVRHGLDVVASAYQQWTAPPAPAYLLRRLRYLPVATWRGGAWYLFNLIRGYVHGKRGFFTWGPRYPGIEQDLRQHSILKVCAKQWVACVEAPLRELGERPRERVFFLRYEDLVTDRSTISRVCDFLNIPDPEAIMKTYDATVRQDAIGRGAHELSTADQAIVQSIIQPTLHRLGY